MAQKPGIIDFLRFHTGIFDKQGKFSVEGLLTFIGRTISRRTKAFVRGLMIGAVAHFFIVGMLGGYNDVVFPLNLIIPVFSSIFSIVTYPPAVVAWMLIGMWFSYWRSLRRQAGGGTAASVIILLPWVAAVSLIDFGLSPVLADAGVPRGGGFNSGMIGLMAQSAIAGVFVGIGWAAGEEAADFVSLAPGVLPAKSADRRQPAEPMPETPKPQAQGPVERERQVIEVLLETFRRRQRQMFEEEKDEFGAPVGLGIVLETCERMDLDTLRDKLAPLFPSIRFGLSYVFPEAASDASTTESDLARYVKLRVPGTPFQDLDASPWELMHHVRDVLEIVRAEPDLETDFYNARELLGLECFEPRDLMPSDRAWALRQMRVPEAWALVPPAGGKRLGEGILVAQPDTGISDHEELRHGAIAPELGANFVELGKPPIDPLVGFPGQHPGHGTSTSSVMASRGSVVAPESGGTGGPGQITGSAPLAVVVPIRAIKSVVRISQTTVAQAVDFATRQGFPIISMSLGGLPSMVLKPALQRAVEQNVIVLAAAGNCVNFVCYPASDDCIAVAATNIREKPWKGSCLGAVDVSAPGELVWMAQRNATSEATTKIAGGQGTSFATALTAGVAALWLAFHGRDRLVASLMPGETLQTRFRWLLKETARVPAGWDHGLMGAGIVDSEALLKADPMPRSEEALKKTRLMPNESGTARDVGRLLEAAVGDLAPHRLSKGELEEQGLEIAWLVMRDRQRLLTDHVPAAKEKLTHAPLPPSERLQEMARKVNDPRLGTLMNA